MVRAMAADLVGALMASSRALVASSTQTTSLLVFGVFGISIFAPRWRTLRQPPTSEALSNYLW